MDYDPLKTPDPERWLELDEQERIDLVQMHHESAGIQLPNATLHAAMHTVVENQLAMKDDKVQETLDRLLAEGLDRHDALHAIGSVLAEQIWGAMQTPPDDTGLPEAYYRGLSDLTAAKWRGAR
jgi:hypothetical protein